MLAAIAREYAQGAAAADRHHQSRPAAAGGLEHRRHRGQRPPGCARRCSAASCWPRASIPGAFPPVLVDVDQPAAPTRRCMWMAARRRRSSSTRPRSTCASVTGPRRRARRIIWVVRNGRMDVEARASAAGVFSIARRSIATLLHFSGDRRHQPHLPDGAARRHRVPPGLYRADFAAERREPFDPPSCRRCSTMATAKGRAGEGLGRGTARCRPAAATADRARRPVQAAAAGHPPCPARHRRDATGTRTASASLAHPMPDAGSASAVRT